MARNIILIVSTLAVLLVLFVGYFVLTGGPAVERAQTSGLAEVEHAAPTTEPVEIQGVTLPPGGRMCTRIYDERTGRPTHLISWDDWRPAPGREKEIIVSKPTIELLLPSGMIATISADEGQLAVDRIETGKMQPKQGWLAGHVRIILDRDTRIERTSREERPDDLITIDVARLDFDLELGEMNTAERISVTANEFSVAGTGLHLVWNQADNRVETLTIERGEQFVLYAAAGLISSMRNPEQLVDGEGPSPATQAAPRPPPKRGDRPRRTTYLCTLAGPVVAEQMRGDEQIGGLQADELRLLFDVGSSAGRAMHAPSAASQPMSQPAAGERERLVVRWAGTLKLSPTETTPDGGGNRRQFVALGQPVVLSQGERGVRCGRVEYHDETQRIWLDPAPGGEVEFRLGPKLSATAASVYVDRTQRIVKLIGAVNLRSQRGGAVASASTIRCAYWAELHISERAAGAAPPADPVLDADRLEFASFIGDVVVELGGETLTAHRLDVAFRPGAEGQSLEDLLDTAVASGGARLARGDDALDCAQLELTFARTEQEELYPRHMNAVGGVVIARGRSTVRGAQVAADLVPPEASSPEHPLFVLRKLQIDGQAELLDPQNKVAARGRTITATFTGLNQLDAAAVVGTPEEFAVVHKRPFTARGARIDLAREALTLRVAGPSQLSFTTRRSLQGAERKEPTPIVITSQESLHVDGQHDTVRFVGAVEARSGDEKLVCDRLTLLLEDVAAPPPPEQVLWQTLWRQARGLLGTPQTERRELFDVATGASFDRVAKEPRRLVADNALVTRETYATGDTQPVVHASLSAPLLEVDIPNRQIFTTGRTQLLLVNRRLDEADDAAHGVPLGVPSALVSRGPSQTAMQCDGRMVYTLGPDGPEQRDTVLFEQAVVFAHRTGREMANLDEMLPQLRDYPNLLDSLRSRNVTMDSGRLEVWLAHGADAPTGGGAFGRLDLASLLASDAVYMRDQESSRIREVNADWVEFDREQAHINVRGAEGDDARVYFEDVERKQFDFHHGQRIVINLRDGTIRSGAITGELHR